MGKTYRNWKGRTGSKNSSHNKVRRMKSLGPKPKKFKFNPRDY